jgi:tetratricopeptide (TPR) repeat protein
MHARSKPGELRKRRTATAAAAPRSDPAPARPRELLAGEAAPRRAGLLAASATLLLLTAFVYLQAARFEFLVFDDDQYVTANPHVRAGLTLDGAQWALRTTHASNWHPLTWVSHMLDVTLFGVTPGWHHGVNVLLHAANGILLLAALYRLTGALARSAVVAALFVVHPLHVESVAWVSERKDVLSTLFGLAALAVWAGYARRGGLGRYVATAALFALSLLAKPMWVTLPFLLLLLDWWPLARAPRGGGPGALWPLAREKLPLFALAVLSSAATYWAQSRGGAVNTLQAIPLLARFENAAVAYAVYLRQTVWPSGLAAFYPHPKSGIDPTSVLAALALLAAASLAVWRAAPHRPYLAVGWLWYLGMLVPVIGLVQVGSQSHADRYTYVPLVGIFILAVWGIGDLAAAPRARAGGASALARPPAIAACAAVAALAIGARGQAATWRTNRALFEHALAVTRENGWAHNNLGVTLANEGKLEEGIVHYREAVRIQPYRFHSRLNLGRALARQGRIDEAIAQYQAALQINPRFADAHSELCGGLARLGRADEALAHCQAALEIEPEHAAAFNNRGVALALRGDQAEAERSYREAIRVNPDYSEARNNLGALLARRQDLAGAIAEFRTALAQQPGYVNAANNLIRALYLKGNYTAAWDEVARLRRSGVEPDPRFLSDLAAKLPQPQ